jgi:hypothetical protein
MALSIGFGNSISLLPAIQATRLLTFASVGLPPTEHTCFFLVALPYGGFSPVRLQGRFIRRGLPLRHKQQCRVVCVHPSCPPLSSSVSSSCVEGRCAFEHHRSSGLHRFTPGALAPTRLCSPGLHRLSGPIRPTRHLATFSLPGRLYAASLLCRNTA